MVFLPLAVPSTVIALGVLLFYIRTPLWGTIWVIALGHAIRFLPFAVRTVSAAILQIHQELEEASWVSGASRVATLKRVTFPLLLPALGNTRIKPRAVNNALAGVNKGSFGKFKISPYELTALPK